MVDINELRKLIDNNMKIDDIAIELSTSRSTIRRTMKKLDIKSKYIESKSYTTKCINCDLDFKSTLCEERKFCSHSCSATYTNKGRTKNKKNETKKCLICEERFLLKRIKDNDKIYCSRDCYETDRKNKRIILVDSGLSHNKVVKKYLIEKHGNCCMECGWDKINITSGNVPIELEHIDGNSENNNLDNLKLLCPNCHSLTPTYKALNLGNGRFNRRKRYNEGKSS